jgi:type IV pilus assembly protein PilA
MVHSGYVRPGGRTRTLSVERVSGEGQSEMSIGSSRRDLEREDGFTLLELMVVVVIIAVLLAIGIPLLMGAQDRAKDTSAKAKASTALKAQKAIYADNGGYGDPSLVEEAEPTLEAETLADGAEAEVLGRVYIRDLSADSVTLVSRSGSGECFWAKAEGGQTLFAKGSCDADDIASLTFGSKWP